MRASTYVDSCLLIAAFAAKDAELARRALAILRDPGRLIVSSHFVWLEVIPKTARHGRAALLDAYMDFFEAGVDYYVLASERLVRKAMELARRYALGAVDALHVAAALEAGCEEFVTAERPTKPFFSVREDGLRFATIHPEPGRYGGR